MEGLLDRIEAAAKVQGADGSSLWDRLVDSSRKTGGDGCDGILLDLAIETGTRILGEASDEEIKAIWQETENAAILESEDDSEDDWNPVREEMEHDILLELMDGLCSRICDEAQNAP